MRTFYLFYIKKEVLKNYELKSNKLYQTLEELYLMKREDFHYGLSMYMQMCNLFNTDLFYRYFDDNKNYRKNKNKYYFQGKESFIIELNPSCFVIKTVTNLPSILKLFNYYNSNIFVCDFESKDYFFIKDYYKAKVAI